jgi:hypothetical protein
MPGQLDLERAAEARAVAGYAPRTCGCGETVEPRLARFSEQLQMSGGNVPTVIWDCLQCNEKRAEPIEEERK